MNRPPRDLVASARGGQPAPSLPGVDGAQHTAVADGPAPFIVDEAEAVEVLATATVADQRPVLAAVAGGKDRTVAGGNEPALRLEEAHRRGLEAPDRGRGEIAGEPPRPTAVARAAYQSSGYVVVAAYDPAILRIGEPEAAEIRHGPEL